MLFFNPYWEPELPVNGGGRDYKNTDAQVPSKELNSF